MDTCWTLIQGAAGGGAREREEFARRYLPLVRGYLRARLGQCARAEEVDDAVQEVFVACFREGGALERAEPGRGAGFRAFLYGVSRNVALHVERARGRRRELAATQTELPADDARLSRIFDRDYARAVMAQVAELMARQAEAMGPEAQRRVELLRLRFEEGHPIRDIARLWEIDAAVVHREYARAGREFKAALRTVVGLNERCAPERLEEECDRLLALLRE